MLMRISHVSPGATFATSRMRDSSKSTSEERLKEKVLLLCHGLRFFMDIFFYLVEMI
jgi:hypothetical protein